MGLWVGGGFWKAALRLGIVFGLLGGCAVNPGPLDPAVREPALQEPAVVEPAVVQPAGQAGEANAEDAGGGRIEVEQPAAAEEGDMKLEDAGGGRLHADVVSVSTSGEAGAYTFNVEVSSPDLGCEQYADWWEVVSLDGKLLYRRILTHSHANEQPFVRSGGPVAIEADTVVIVRAHMKPGGYSGTALQGSAAVGFTQAALDPGFGADLEQSEPLPDGCAF